MKEVDHSASNQIIENYLGDNIYSKEVYYPNLDTAYDSMKNQWDSNYRYKISVNNNKKITVKAYNNWSKEFIGYLGEY
tara:strand:+ start:137 stop:370 length:234 start_codon:yes stop_codon:yes gene_type:complete